MGNLEEQKHHILIDLTHVVCITQKIECKKPTKDFRASESESGSSLLSIREAVSLKTSMDNTVIITSVGYDDVECVHNEGCAQYLTNAATRSTRSLPVNRHQLPPR